MCPFRGSRSKDVRGESSQGGRVDGRRYLCLGHTIIMPFGPALEHTFQNFDGTPKIRKEKARERESVKETEGVRERWRAWM